MALRRMPCVSSWTTIPGSRFGVFRGRRWANHKMQLVPMFQMNPPATCDWPCSSFVGKPQEWTSHTQLFIDPSRDHECVSGLEENILRNITSLDNFVVVESNTLFGSIRLSAQYVNFFPLRKVPEASRQRNGIEYR